MRLKNRTTEEIQQELFLIHKGKYEYIDFPEKLNFKSKIKIRCEIHGIFEQRIDHHLNGSRCPRCANSFSKTQEEFLSELKNKYGEQFIYDKVNYKGAHKNVILICPIHGELERAPTRLLTTNCKCLSCCNKKIFNTEDFIREARKVYPNYDFSLVQYKNAKTPMRIICPEHGEFEKSSDALMNKSGCPKCFIHSSKPEKLWLDSLNIPHLERQKTIKINGKRYKLDGYDPKTNTVFEFHGDFWHGNPQFYEPNKINKAVGKSFGYLYQKTKNRESEIKGAGYNYIYIWESVFLLSLDKKPYLPILDSWNHECLKRLYYYKLWEYADGEDCYIDPVALIRP